MSGKLTLSAFVIFCLSAFVPLAHAQDLASQIVAGVSRAPVLRAEFTQIKTIAALTRPLVTSGRFTYVRGQGLLWRIEQPYRATYVLNEQGIVEIGDNGVARAPTAAPGLQHVSRIFRALFEPDVALLQQYFDTTANGDAARWELVLTPQQAALRHVFKNVRIHGARFVDDVKLDEANGDFTVIRFRRTQEAATPDDDEQRLLRRQ